MFPIFVADRPASLRILSKLDINKHDFGILSHPYTSENFKRKFHDFKCHIKVCDSGIYQSDTLTYEELFAEYKKMGADYGIIKDYYRNRKKTRDSAQAGYKIYKKFGYDRVFKLIGVAQGNSVAEYIQSYKEQKDLGLEVVAIGGLLGRMPPEVKIASVRVESDLVLKKVLQAIRDLYPNDKLFPLGVFSKRRFDTFLEQDVWVSDYKGWIFRYNIKQSHEKGDRYEQVVKYIESEIFDELDARPVRETPKKEIMQKQKKKRLLIMSCGKAKGDSPGRAIDVYLGPTFQMVRKYLRTNNGIDVKIISAKYGIIDHKDRISPYELKLNRETASIYGSTVSSFVSEWPKIYTDIFIVGGKTYQSVFPTAPRDMRAEGRIGEQLSQLKRWLYSTEPV